MRPLRRVKSSLLVRYPGCAPLLRDRRRANCRRERLSCGHVIYVPLSARPARRRRCYLCGFELMRLGIRLINWALSLNCWGATLARCWGLVQ